MLGRNHRFLILPVRLGGGGKYVLLKGSTRLEPPTSGSGVRGVNQAIAPPQMKIVHGKLCIVNQHIMMHCIASDYSLMLGLCPLCDLH